MVIPVSISLARLVSSRNSDSGVVIRMSAPSLAKARRSPDGVSPDRTATETSGTCTPLRAASEPMPTSGDRRFRSTSTASAFSGERYRTVHFRDPAAAAGAVTRASMAERNAASVLPDPVGATTSVFSPRPIASQAPACAGVGSAKLALNQSPDEWGEPVQRGHGRAGGDGVQGLPAVPCPVLPGHADIVLVRHDTRGSARSGPSGEPPVPAGRQRGPGSVEADCHLFVDRAIVRPAVQHHSSTGGHWTTMGARDEALRDGPPTARRAPQPPVRHVPRPDGTGWWNNETAPAEMSRSGPGHLGRIPESAAKREATQPLRASPGRSGGPVQRTDGVLIRSGPERQGRRGSRRADGVAQQLGPPDRPACPGPLGGQPGSHPRGSSTRCAGSSNCPPRRRPDPEKSSCE